MFDVYTHSSQWSVKISKMAGVLGGICVEQTEKQGRFEQKFQFDLESKAEQFAASVLWFPEVFGVGLKANVLDAITDQELELKQKFPTLAQLGGDLNEKQAP
jgi:hypothetical protein